MSYIVQYREVSHYRPGSAARSEWTPYLGFSSRRAAEQFISQIDQSRFAEFVRKPGADDDDGECLSVDEYEFQVVAKPE